MCNVINYFYNPNDRLSLSNRYLSKRQNQWPLQHRGEAESRKVWRRKPRPPQTTAAPQFSFSGSRVVHRTSLYSRSLLEDKKDSSTCPTQNTIYLNRSMKSIQLIASTAFKASMTVLLPHFLPDTLFFLWLTLFFFWW